MGDELLRDHRRIGGNPANNLYVTVADLTLAVAGATGAATFTTTAANSTGVGFAVALS